MRVVIVGAGIGGLAVALRLGRADHDVVVVDRDPPPPPSVLEAFNGWRRRSVRQWRQYHVFRARARLELERSAPDVLDGVAEADAIVAASTRGSTPPAQGVRGELHGLPVRRPVLEWVLRQKVENCPRVRVLPSMTIAALSLDPRRRDVTGVRPAKGGEMYADLVVDAAGRRSPIRGWSIAAGFECPPEERAPCGIAYYSRYYETLSAEAAPRLMEEVEVTDHGFMASALARGDGGTIGAIFVVPSHRAGFRGLGTAEGWDTAVGRVPRMADVLGGHTRRPMMDPTAMYGLENAVLPWAADGLYGPRRLAPVGDSWLVTNPNLAWGSSIALAQAFALADALDRHGQDVDSAIEAYRAHCLEEVRQLFQSACEIDRGMQRRWRLRSPEQVADDLGREALLFGLQRLARHGDRDVARRLALRSNLLELPDEVWNDELLLAKARRSLAERPYDPARRPRTIDEWSFLDAVARAARTASEARRRSPTAQTSSAPRAKRSVDTSTSGS